MKKLLLAKKFDAKKHEPTGMLMSEKIDGVRAYWDSRKRKLYTRTGNRINAPDWFTDDFPPHDCDGEIHAGRGTFQKVQGIVRSKKSDQWGTLRYSIFDDLGQGIFEERYNRIRSLWGSYYDCVQHWLCHSDDHLLRNLKFIEENGGEGMMLRDPQSLYTNGRSESLLKVKSFDDAEAKVIDHVKGDPLNDGVIMLGAIVCELANGVTFRIGSGLSDDDCLSGKPKIGSQITFRHYGFTERGVPRFASYLRTREEL